MAGSRTGREKSREDGPEEDDGDRARRRSRPAEAGPATGDRRPAGSGHRAWGDNGERRDLRCFTSTEGQLEVMITRWGG